MDISKEEYLEQLSKELHKPTRKKFPRRKVRVPSKDHTWSMDLVDMKPWSRKNRGMKWMLNIVDVWTRYAWSVPIKTKSAQDVLDAFKSVIDSSGRKPEKIWLDQGTEFYNRLWTAYIAEKDIVRYSTYGKHKSMICERFNRTLKTEMWKRFTARQDNDWMSHHVALLEWYNHRPHSSLQGQTPYAVSQPDSDYVPIDNLCFGDDKTEEKLKPKFNIGDVVRISRAKTIFEKGYTANWSQEQFIIKGMRVSKCSDPPTYSLMDWHHKRVKGGFYEPELQLVKFPFVYLVEKVIKRNPDKKKVLVKWIGLPNTHNEWIDDDQMLDAE